MEKNKYYKNLVALFEDMKVRESLQEAPMPMYPQQQSIQQEPPIRDIPNNIDPSMQQQPMEDEMMQDPALSDADYLQGNDPMMMMAEPQLSPIEDAIEVSEQKKLIKLLGLYRELMNYTTVFYENFEDVDTTTLDSEINNEIREQKNKILALKEKLRSYIIDRYADEKYEKSLYVYILLRTELLSIIIILRRLLGVDKKEKDSKTKTENNIK